MYLHLLETVGKIAGLGGIAIGAILIFFREVIRKNIFPRFTPKDAYRIIRLLSVLMFGISALGVLAWAYVQTHVAVAANTEPKYDDPVKQACMNGSLVDCQNYSMRVSSGCSQFDVQCKLLATCWQDKVRALQVVDFACKQSKESCDFQKANMRATLALDCDNRKLSDRW